MPIRTESHHAPVARLQDGLRRAPVPHVVRPGEHDLAAGAVVGRHRTVEEDPSSVDPLRQNRRVLVLGLADDPDPLDRSKVRRRGEIDGRAARAVGRAGYDPALELAHPDRAGVFEAPLLALDALRRREQGLGSDRPSTQAVGRARDSQMGDASAILDAREHHGLAVHDRRSRVEDGVDRFAPVAGGQDRIAGMTPEHLVARHHAALARSVRRSRAGRAAASRSSCARWKASVDSAPSFAFRSVSPRPSLQPPVAKS